MAGEQRRSRRIGTQTLILRQLIVLYLSTLLFASIARAQSFDSSWLTFFPSDVSGFACLDLSRARSFSSYLQVREQLVPASVNSFEQFLYLPMMGEGTEIDEAVWAIPLRGNGTQHKEATGGRIMGLALGHFHPDIATAFLSDRRVPSENLGNYTAYPTVDFDHDPAYVSPPDGTIWFIFFDSNTVAFGSLELLRRMVNAHDSEEVNLSDNETMLALIEQAESDGIFWGVFGANATRTVLRQLAPRVTAVSGASELGSKMSTLQVNIDSSFQSSLEITFWLEAGSPSVARSYAQLLATATLQRRQMVKNDNPDLAAVLDTVRIYSSGTEVGITLTPSDDQVRELLRVNPFAPNP